MIPLYEVKWVDGHLGEFRTNNIEVRKIFFFFFFILAKYEY